MFSNEYLNELKELAKTSTEAANLQMQLLDGTMDEMLRKVDDKEKPQIEALTAVIRRSIALAKQGKTKAAQETIKTYSNGRKSSKKNV